jgi:two-component system response regulator PilR (NtrC family)
MRRMEEWPTDSGRRRAHIIEECRQVLAARSMSLCHLRNDGQLAVVSVAGAPPDDETAREMTARLATRSRRWFSVISHREQFDLAIAGRGSDGVCAVLPHPTEAWAEDFVAFVAERFIHSASKTSIDVHPPVTARGLVLPPAMVVGSSAAMQELLRQMTNTVSSGLDVVLSGETGTGKELLARVVHDSGPSCGGPFVALNCAAIPGELLEAELFGVERRVATGVDPRVGLFVKADQGSILLDEIGELPERLQPKLLRALQEREVLPLGATRPRKIVVRVISASNRDLSSLVANGAFRADLYYRLRGLEFRVPPLRERSEDIATLALELTARAADDYGKHILGITSSALNLLQDHPWPGNVRELQSEVRRAVLLCESGGSLQPKHFSPSSQAVVASPVIPAEDRQIPLPSGDDRNGSLREQVNAIERAAIEHALETATWNHSRAARILGITRNGLSHKMQRLGIEAQNR